jgi:hypothetical protein
MTKKTDTKFSSMLCRATSGLNTGPVRKYRDVPEEKLQKEVETCVGASCRETTATATNSLQIEFYLNACYDDVVSCEVYTSSIINE